MQGVHGKLEPAGGPLLEEEHNGRHQDCDAGQGRGEVEVLAALAQVLVVDQHRERLEALAQQHRRAEVGKGLHEHHQGRRQDRGHGQCQHNVEQAAHTDAAHIGGGLHQRVVDVLERAVHVDEHQGEELQGLDD